MRADRARRRRRRRARRRGVDGRRGARRPRGARAARRRVRRRPRAQRDRRLRRPRPDDRRAHRGHRRRARQQGVARRRRRARDRARRGDRRAADPGRLRALRAAPAARRRAAGRGRAARSSPPPAARSAAARERARGRHRRAGARAPDLGDGRQDHDRLGDADEQGPRGDRGPPPVRHAVRPDRRRRAPAVDRPRAGASCATARRSRTSGYPDMRVPIAYALHHPERVDVPVPTARPRRGRRARPSSRPTSTRSRACAWRARPRVAGGTAPCVLNAANEVAVARLPRRPAGLPRHPGGDRGRRSSASAPRRVHAFEALYEADARGARASPAS